MAWNQSERALYNSYFINAYFQQLIPSFLELFWNLLIYSELRVFKIMPGEMCFDLAKHAKQLDEDL